MIERLAVVTWLDADRTEGGDEVKSTGAIGVLRHTVGYILRSDDEGVVIAMTKDDQVDGTRHEMGFGIPRVYVKKIRLLK